MDELVVSRIRNQLIRTPLEDWVYPMHWDNRYFGEYVQVDDRGFFVDIDMGTYKPHEVKVITTDDYVFIEGKQLERSIKGHYVLEKNFTRRYRLPRGLKPKNIVSNLSSDGILNIKALPSM